MLCGIFWKREKYVVQQEMKKTWNFAKRFIEISLGDEKILVLLSSENSMRR